MYESKLIIRRIENKDHIIGDVQHPNVSSIYSRRGASELNRSGLNGSGSVGW